MRRSMTTRVPSSVTSTGEASTHRERREDTTNEKTNVTATSFQNGRGRLAWSSENGASPSSSHPSAAGSVTVADASNGMPANARMPESDGPPAMGCQDGEPMTVK